MPTTVLTVSDFEEGKIDILNLLINCGFSQSRGEAKRLIQQGGVSVNDEAISAIDKKYEQNDLKNGLIIKKGKKHFHKVIFE